VKPFDVVAQLRIESGKRWADVAVSWQLADLRAVLAGDVAMHFLVRPRGGSKTSDLAAVAIAWLLSASPGARYFAAAGDRDQARLLVDAVQGFAARSPSIAEALTIDRWRVTVKDTGATLEVLASDLGSSWGLRPSGLIVDEIGWWDDTDANRTLVDSLLSSAAKVAGCRVAVLTSPSAPSHFSYGLREHAERDPMWRLSETPGPIAWMAPEVVAEQQRRLSPAMFARLFLGQWVEAEDALVDAEALRDAVRHEGPLDPKGDAVYVITLDVGLKRDRTAAVVAHAEADQVIVDRVAIWQGSTAEPVSLDAVEEWIVEASGRYNGAEVIADPWQSVGLLQRLRVRGVRGEEFAFTAQSVGRLASALFNTLRDRRIALPDDEDLLDELAHVKLRESSPGVFRLDHVSGRHDDRAVALALAVHRLQTTRTGIAMPVAFRIDPRTDPFPPLPPPDSMSDYADPGDLTGDLGDVVF